MYLTHSIAYFVCCAALFSSGVLLAQSGHPAPALITQSVDGVQRVTLRGNVRPEANVVHDRGRLAENTPVEHMLLQLKRSPEQEAALAAFIDQLQTPGSANYHKWLTAAEFGQRFGLAQADLDTIANWLTGEGFTVNTVYPSGMLIDFSGTAGAVRQAFGTELHRLNVDGTTHIANMTNPQIPAALAPVIKGIVSLHDFRPHAMARVKPQYTYTSGGATYEAVVPGDLATIYNFNPVFAAGITGTGQTIVVLEDADLYTANDFANFQSKFKLGGTLVTAHPQPASGSANCSDPGTGSGDDFETTVDAEWALAAAPSATIEIAACGDTTTTFGGLIAMENLLNSAGVPQIMSISYGECEAENGASANAAYNAAYQQAVSEGVSVFVSAGDEGAAGCDAGSDFASHGLGVNAFAATPYNVAVGGTDFGDTYMGESGSYWSATNSPTYSSANAYMPEMPWNDSCASQLIAYYEGYGQTWGANGFCNSSIGKADFITLSAGSGGPSGCFTGAPSTTGVVSGSCAGVQKPSWQSIVGNPNDGVRDLPDVSLFASNGVWGHYYVMCFSDTKNGGSSCAGDLSTWTGAGGTSFAAPVMAGLQALINEIHGPQGNPNPVYYALAGKQYGSNGNSSCNATLGYMVGSSCIFHDVTAGDIDVPCGGANSCWDSSGTGRSRVYGVLYPVTSLVPAYNAGVGWDFATGIGSVNATNLVVAWP